MLLGSDICLMPYEVALLKKTSWKKAFCLGLEVVMKHRSVLGKALLVLLMLFLVVTPLFGRVKRVTGRVIQAPSNITSVRKANFKLGDILTIPMLSMTISNDVTPATLLLVLELEIESASIGEDKTAIINLERNFAANESITFTNTDILNYVSNVTGGSVPDSFRTAFGVTNTELSAVTEDFFTNPNIRMPEGTYTLRLKAFDKVEGQKGSTQSVDFIVVNVGSLSVLQSPTLLDRTFKFRVPQIPYYSTVSADKDTRSTTRITVEGPGLKQTITKSHTRVVASTGSTIKGYPGDLQNGEVSYDLSSINFRAGEEYSFLVEFIDAKGFEIARLTQTVKFPTPRFNTALDTSSPYRPEFSWSFSNDYESWAKEYRIYLNGSYYGFSTTNSFRPTSSLLPNTQYTWYVMPINKDNTPFFPSSSGLSKTFTTKAHTDLTISLDSPNNNAILITGQSYGFSGSPSFSDEATLQSATWRIGTETRTGTSISYTPTRRYASNSLMAYLTIVDSLNLSKNSNTLYLTVLDPAIAISGGSSRTVAKDSATTFALDTANSRDLNRIEWFINDQSIGEGANRSYTFTESGSYRVYAKGSSVADFNGFTKEVQSSTQTITVIGDAPSVSITQPANVVEMIAGNTLNLRSLVTADNQIAQVSWLYSGAASGSLGNNPNSAVFTPRTAGEYTITLSVTDIHQKTSTATTRILVIDPQVNLSYPQANTTFALNASLTPVIVAPNAQRIVYVINNQQYTSPTLALASLGTGTFSIIARAYWNTVDQSGNPSEYSKDSAAITFSVKDLQPPAITITFPQDNMVLKTTEAYRFQAEVSSSTAIRESWWEVDGSRVNTQTYTAPASTTKKTLTVSHHAVNQDGVKGSKSVQVSLANPSVFLTPPSNNLFLASSVIPVSATVIDAQLFWVIDDQEVADWNRTIENPGTYSIQAGWRMEAVDGNARQRTFTGLSPKQNITIYSNKAPTISTFSPNTSLVNQVSQVPVVFSVQVSSENQLQPTRWTIYSGDQVIREASAASISHQSWTPGIYTVQALVRDLYNQSVLQEWTVRIIDPKISITSPTPGIRYALGQVPRPVIETQDLSSYTMTLNGTTISEQFNYNGLRAGQYTLAVVGSYTTTGGTQVQTTPAQSVTFRVEDRTPPQFEVSPINNNDRLIAGQRYSLVASASANETFTWLINGSIVGQGNSYTLTPSASDRALTLTVRGLRNDITVDKTYALRVIDPFISITLPANLAFNNLYAPNTPIPLLYESRDIDRVVWRVDLRPYTQSTVTFNEGMHSIDVDGYATSVRLPDGTLGDYLPTTTSGITGRDIQIAELQHVSSIVAPDKILEGQSFAIEAVIAAQSNTDLIASLTYLINGRIFKEERRPVSKTATISNLAPGNHVLAVRSTDVFGNSRTVEKNITVFKPLSIAISSPRDGSQISPDTNILGSLEVLAGKERLVTWRVDNRVIANSNFLTGSLGKLTPGRHTITASAQDDLGNTISAQVQIEVQSDFQLNVVQPSSSVEALIGNTVTCLVGVDKVIGSSIDLSDAARYITWFVNGQSTQATGLSYQFIAERSGTFTVSARYSHNNMVRTTSERTIVVRDIAAPVIVSPLNGQTITYAQGRTIPLLATGESGATFIWRIGDRVVAVGSDTSFDPQGLTDSVQLTLETTAFSRSRVQLVTVNLRQNLPPTLTLTVPAVQYTTDALQWTATAFDAEDRQANPLITYTLDGVTLNPAVQRILASDDVGTHTLTARTVDSLGEATVQRATFRVVESNLNLNILSPKQETPYFRGYEVPLIASLPSDEQGTYSWSVQYLDQSTLARETFTGKDAVFTAKGTGKVEVTAVFVDANNRERARRRFTIEVKNEPLVLSINWPHGSIVNAGAALRPTLLGVPASQNGASINWFLNGSAVDDIANLLAPERGGSYTLTAIYRHEQVSDKAEVTFTVNARPTIAITSLSANRAYSVGTPLVLAAQIVDEQAALVKVRWLDAQGTVLAEGNPAVFTPAQAGEVEIIAEAVDSQLLSARSAVPVRFYAPLQATEMLVNNGMPTYLISETSAPMPLSVNLAGGVAPQVTWRVVQQNRVLEKRGRQIFLSFAELTQLARQEAVVSMIISDITSTSPEPVEIIRRDFPITFTSDATLQFIHPLSDTILRVGDPVLLQAALTGFTNPTITLAINKAAVPAVWELGEGAKVASTTLDANLLQNEGVYELEIRVAENGVQRSTVTNLNLYKERAGIFVDNAPEVFNLLGDDRILTATLSGLSRVDRVLWKTDLSPETPVATGMNLSLKQANLRAGSRAIIVEAYAGNSLEASKTILISVLDKVTVALNTEEAVLILQRGADFVLSATARDRNGTALSASSLTWRSHLDGQLASGSSLSFANLSTISLGEHIITVEAVGSDGSTGTAMQAVRINGVEVAPPSASTQTSDQDTGGGAGQTGDQMPGGTSDPSGGPPDYFGMGEPIDMFMPPHYPDPFGPGMGGAPPDPGLGNFMNDFFGGYGGGFGGGGFSGGFGGGAPGGFGGGFGW